MTAQSSYGLKEAKADREFWGRFLESAVGAHLVNAAAAGECEVFYWRERSVEVDFVIRVGRTLTALEVRRLLLSTLETASYRCRSQQRGRCSL
jgi:predicted AAA+ superfamily ATPase